MEVRLKRLNNGVHFVAESEEGHAVHLDGSPQIGGVDAGVRPMQLLLMGLGGCSGIDVVSILKKQKQEPDDLQIRIEGKRGDSVPALFEQIAVHFEFEGELDPEKCKRAVSLSIDKYCSVAKTLEQTATIGYTITLNDHRIYPA